MNEHYERSGRSIAQNALTNSKRAESFVKGIYPTHVSFGTGCHLHDTNNRKYIDFICGLGTNLLGYGDPGVARRVYQAACSGLSLSLNTPEEYICAEKVKELFPFIETMKFLKTGTEACIAAVKIARAATGRDKILSEGYHGWTDEFVSLTPPARGVPPCAHIGKLDEFKYIDHTVAAVILEPVMVDDSQSRRDWLHGLRARCTEVGALLIFDEIITGFRFSHYSVANCYGIKPDLICLGKAIANGMPLAVVGGPYALMDDLNYFVSSTFAGERASLMAATEVMTRLQKGNMTPYLWAFGSIWRERFNKLWPEGLQIKGYATRGVLEGDPLIKALFMQETCLAGMLFGPSWFISHAHMAIDNDYFSSIEEILCQIKMGRVKLKGEMPRSPFSAKAREVTASTSAPELAKLDHETTTTRSTQPISI